MQLIRSSILLKMACKSRTAIDNETPSVLPTVQFDFPSKNITVQTLNSITKKSLLKVKGNSVVHMPKDNYKTNSELMLVFGYILMCS